MEGWNWLLGAIFAVIVGLAATGCSTFAAMPTIKKLWREFSGGNHVMTLTEISRGKSSFEAKKDLFSIAI